MTFETFLPLISAVLVFFLGFFVWGKNKKDKVNFTFALFALVITIWMFGTFMMFLNKGNREAVIFWDKFVYAGVVFIPVIMLHFGLALTNNKGKTGKFFLAVGYLVSTVFLILIPTKLFIDDAFIYEWGAHTKAQFFHHIFLVYFTVYLVSWFVIVYRHYKKVSSIEQERIKYCFLAFLILALFGSLGYLPAYGISVYPFAYVSGLIFVIILAYAIVVHRLLDIKLALRRSIVYLFSILAVAVPASGVLYLVNQFAPQYATYASIAVLIAAVSVFSPIRNYYYRVANKYFFSSLYDSREVISRVSDGLRSTLEITEIYGFIAQVLMGSLHTKAVSILNYDSLRKEYIVQFDNGFAFAGRKNFPKDSGLQEEYGKQSKIMVVEEIKSTAYRQYKEIVDLLVSVNVAAVVPLNVKNEILGVIFLGTKESGDMYNDEDLRTLETIASQAAMAIKNAQLYEEAKGFSLTLQKEVERQTKELKQANEDLKKLDKAKSDFISIASHQLRTPLTAIKGFTSMILEGSYGRTTKVVHDKLEKIYESAERLIRLVNDLLNLSHMEGGKMEFDFQKINLTQMVKSVCEELDIQAQKKKLKLTVNLPEGDLFVKADEQKLRQVVMNLIDNAIKYTEKGKAEVFVKEIDGKIQFSVKDTGLGMKPEEIAGLFQKFVRGSEASHYHTEGAGIGLYVARQLIEAHQGRVWAESEGEGKGSTFLVEMAEWQE